ncbi:MAG: pyridoxal 5'-phosphate synthase glutaminase subunit PdxT [Candidatus Eremiobacteraeota bacterium]|nr:pyridoxal 5'-phosphate synthase glutaminase subunit PdxT [Candidatus Eremiobacteraeota bacterium]
MVATTPRVGVLALQGDVEEHLLALRASKADARPVKAAAQLAEIDGLIIPGGESTTVSAMMERFGLAEPLRSRVADGMPVWGSCMGMIVMAEKVVDSQQPTLGLLHVEVRRNAFGRQAQSAEVWLPIAEIDRRKPFPAVFIRAPWIESAWGGARLLAELDGKGVMVRQEGLLGTSFHPELTQDLRVHQYFLKMIESAARG